jgi:anti-anti-sigma regulatory factor
MLKITRVQNGEAVVKLIGRMDGEHVSDMERLLSEEASDRPLVLNLKDLTLVDQDAVSFLRRCETEGIQLRDCPAYIREWLNGER